MHIITLSSFLMDHGVIYMAWVYVLAKHSVFLRGPGWPGTRKHVTLDTTYRHDLIGRGQCTEPSSQRPSTFNNLCWSKVKSVVQCLANDRELS